MRTARFWTQFAGCRRELAEKKGEAYYHNGSAKTTSVNRPCNSMRRDLWTRTTYMTNPSSSAGTVRIVPGVLAFLGPAKSCWTWSLVLTRLPSTLRQDRFPSVSSQDRALRPGVCVEAFQLSSYCCAVGCQLFQPVKRSSAEGPLSFSLPRHD